MVKEIICLTDGQPILVDDEDHKVSKGMTHNVLIDAIPEANPTYFLAAFPAVKITLTETCHDMGMRAYFQWKGYSQERAEQEYDIAYFATLRKFSPDHPHLKYAPEAA